MMLRSKILKTKKRLSDNPWLLVIQVISSMGLMFTVAFAFRAVSIAQVFGVVKVDIPVMPVPVKDPGFHTFEETPGTALLPSTPAVVMTTDNFFFGDLNAFSRGFANVNDKWAIPTEDGQHRVDTLLDALENWLVARSTNDLVRPQQVVVLIPAGDIPAYVLIQVIAGLKSSTLIDRVVLGSGLI
jgi:hypothetical protein